MRSATDKQLVGIKLTDVLEKRRLGQALNLKEFAVLAGVSYSVAREWAHIPGFPRFEGVIFWNDFEEWRKEENRRRAPISRVTVPAVASGHSSHKFPPRANKILESAIHN